MDAMVFQKYVIGEIYEKLLVQHAGIIHARAPVGKPEEIFKKKSQRSFEKISKKCQKENLGKSLDKFKKKAFFLGL